MRLSDKLFKHFLAISSTSKLPSFESGFGIKQDENVLSRRYVFENFFEKFKNIFFRKMSHSAEKIERGDPLVFPVL